jgi:hypothetical protein
MKLGQVADGGDLQARFDKVKPPAEPSSWKRVDLSAALSGDRGVKAPDMLARTDGASILYPGRVTWISSPPEGGKTWIALKQCADTIMAGRYAFYIDYEGYDGGIVERLLALGATSEAILKYFHYHRPAERLTRVTSEEVLRDAWMTEPVTAVIDGVMAGMGLNDLDANSAGDFYKWWYLLGGPLHELTVGPTLVLDHVVKNGRDDDRYASGTGQKLALVDVHLGLKVHSPFGRGRTGDAEIVLHKDRYGYLRKIASEGMPQRLGRLMLASHDDTATLTIEPPTGGNRFRPTFYMEAVSRMVEINGSTGIAQSKTAIERGVVGKAEYIRRAVDALVAEGYLRMVPGKTVAGKPSAVYISVREYREATDPEVKS